MTALPPQVLKLLEGKDGGVKKKHPKLGDQARMTVRPGYLTLPPNRSPHGPPKGYLILRGYFSLTLN